MDEVWEKQSYAEVASTPEYVPTDEEIGAEIKRMKDMSEEDIARESLENKHQIRTDYLTGLLSTRGLYEELNKIETRLFTHSPEEEKRDAAKSQIVSIAVGDLVGLGFVNDRYGRIEGNNYLKNVARTLNMVIKRESDLTAVVPSGTLFIKDRKAARLGEQSDEVALVLPGDSSDDAFKIIQRVNDDLEKIQERVQERLPGIRYRLSVSIAQAKSGEKLVETFNRAQGTLHEAKEKYERISEDKKSKSVDVGIVVAD
jgi:diguanylate cyclase (GGDEF)-like protein